MGDDTLTVQFSKDCDVKDEEGAVVLSFRVGEVYALSKASAERWIRRKAAYLCEGEPSGSPDPAKAKPKQQRKPKKKRVMTKGAPDAATTRNAPIT